jgi:hypothetical protein
MSVEDGRERIQEDPNSIGPGGYSGSQKRVRKCCPRQLPTNIAYYLNV